MFFLAKFHPQAVVQLSSGMPHAACPTKCLVDVPLDFETAYTGSFSSSWTRGLCSIFFSGESSSFGDAFALGLRALFRCRSCWTFCSSSNSSDPRFVMFIGISVIASSMYLNTADDFHLPKNWMWWMLVPSLAYAIAPDRLAE